MLSSQSTLNEIEILYKKSSTFNNKLTCSQDTFELAKHIYQLTNSNLDLKEYFFVIMLNRANNVTGYLKLSEGGVTGTVADSRLIFSAALKSLASSVVLVHNHPSGNTEPSQADIKLTNKLVEIGKLMEIPVLDHLIISSKAYHSFANNNGVC